MFNARLSYPINCVFKVELLNAKNADRLRTVLTCLSLKGFYGPSALAQQRIYLSYNACPFHITYIRLAHNHIHYHIMQCQIIITINEHLPWRPHSYSQCKWKAVWAAKVLHKHAVRYCHPQTILHTPPLGHLEIFHHSLYLKWLSGWM